VVRRPIAGDRDMVRVLHFYGWSRLRAIVAWCAAFVASLSLVSCAPAQIPPAESVAGPTFVSLNPCVDAMLVEVADPDQILALSHYSRDPSASSVEPQIASRFAVTGGTAEEVLALQPDVVLASTFIAPSTRAAFEQLGLRVETFGSPTTIAESIAQVRQLAKLTEREREGERFAQYIEGPRLEGSPRSVNTLLWQPGQIVPGQSTLINELMERNRFVSHSSEMGLRQADHVSLERILSDPPELLLIAGSSAGQSHPLLDQLEGTQVEHIEPNLLYCGARTIVDVQMRFDSIRAELLQ